MKKLILSAIMFISVAGIAVAQDTTGAKHKAGTTKGMDKKDKKWSGKDSASHSGKMGTSGKMKKDTTNH